MSSDQRRTVNKEERGYSERGSLMLYLTDLSSYPDDGETTLLFNLAASRIRRRALPKRFLARSLKGNVALLKSESRFYAGGSGAPAGSPVSDGRDTGEEGGEGETD
jgi:hypothetical protein